MAPPTYRLLVTVELERLSSEDSSLDWRGAGKIETLADLPTLFVLAEDASMTSGVQALIRRIVAEEDARHHG